MCLNNTRYTSKFWERLDIQNRSKHTLFTSRQMCQEINDFQWDPSEVSIPSWLEYMLHKPGDPGSKSWRNDFGDSLHYLGKRW